MNVMEYIETNVAKDFSGEENLSSNIEKANTFYNTIAESLKKKKIINHEVKKQEAIELTPEGLSQLKDDMKDRERPTLPEEPDEVPVFDPHMYDDKPAGNFVIDDNGEIER